MDPERDRDSAQNKTEDIGSDPAVSPANGKQDAVSSPQSAVDKDNIETVQDCSNVKTENGSGETGAEGDDGVTEIKIPREHARLDLLLTQIPKKAQHGLLMQCDLILTCIDVSEQYIALGTNIGLTFLYNRRTHNVQRLKSETSSDVITCVKLHHGVDHQLATGMASGILTIFLIPSMISLHKKQMQKFDVRSVHRHYISCVEWSTNGMKLFSGDKTGHVVVTEVDFYQGECKSSLLLVEPPTEIIQLNYDHKVLLVSSKQRSFVCRLDTTNEAVQVGQQDRKVQGNFGAAFIPALCKVDDALLYAVRPGCRIWLSNIQGSVLNTHIFKDSISAGVREIPILKPARSSFNPTAELQFGRLHMYGDRQLITYNTTSIFLLDPQMNCVLASQSQLGGIVDIAVHKDEVFVLRRQGDTAVVRIAYEPEVTYSTGLPFDLPLSTTTTMDSPATTTTTTTTETASNQDSKEENKTKTFFKKTFLSPFKKLDNFIQERTHQSKEVVAEPSPDLRPVISGSSDSSSPTAVPSKESSPDLPPVVALDSPDLAVRIFTGGVKGAGTPVDVQSPDSAHSALSVFAEEVGREKGVVSPVDGESKIKIEVNEPADSSDRTLTGERNVPIPGDRLHLSASQAQDSTDIVFSHQMHKKKAKKKKGKGKGDKESDNISQASFGSQVSVEMRTDTGDGSHQQLQDSSGQGDVDEILRRAEEALASAGNLLKGSGDKVDGEHSLVGTAPVEIPEDREENSLDKADQSDSISVESRSQDQREDQVHSVNVMTSPQTLAEEDIASPDQAPGAVSGAAETNTSEGADDEQKRSGEEKMTVRSESSGTTGQPVSVSDGPLEMSPHTGTEQVDETKLKTVTSTSKETPDPAEMPREGLDPLVAAERTLDKMNQGFKLPESTDDFYSMFSSPYSPADHDESPAITPKEHHTFDQFGNGNEAEVEQQEPVHSASEKSVAVATLQKLANSWSEFTTPANIYSLALSSTHVWFTDKSENLYYSTLGTAKGIVWRKVGESASQISVSPSGHIVWRLHRGRVFAGTKITQRRPEGLKWVEAVNSVVHISADDSCAWYVKANGDVMMQRGLSKERPCFRSVTVETEHKVKQVMARYGVVWAVTDAMKLLVRTGISNDYPQGLAWHEVHRDTGPFLFSCVTVDNEAIGWAVDVLGQIWFTDKVTPQTPVGSGKWWQVPLSEYFVQDPSLLDMIRSLAKKFDTQKLSHLLHTHRGGLIVAGQQGVWLSLDFLNTLYVCRSSLQGYQWLTVHPPRMASSAVWKQVQAGIADLDWGTVWAQLVNSELYALPDDNSDATSVNSPGFVSYSVNKNCVWGLTGDGELYTRTGMGQHCPLGVDWIQLDLAQLGDVFLVHVSCSSSYVWVVDGDGQVFHRIGSSPPKPGQLNPAWLPIDTYSEIIFTKVVIGPLDWMVWAVDNRRLTYVRMGISEELPIGKEWVHVPGIQAMDLALSSSGVWALNTNGEILFRYGITEEDVSGNYWKKIPGCFTRISASPTDVLWAVNTQGQLVKCSCHHLYRRQDSADPLIQRGTSVASEEGDWELV